MRGIKIVIGLPLFSLRVTRLPPVALALCTYLCRIVVQTVETLCRGIPALAEYLSYVRGLRPGQAADYAHAERIFTDGLRRRGFPPDAPFDWMHSSFQHPAKAAALATGPAARSKIQGLGMAGAGSPALSASTAAVKAKRPRVVADSSAMAAPGVAATGVRLVGNEVGIAGGGPRSGRSPFSAAVAPLDLYADVPPPDPSYVRTSNAVTGDGTGGTTKTVATASGKNAPPVEVVPTAREADGVVAPDATPAVVGTSEAKTVAGKPVPAEASYASRAHRPTSEAPAARAGDGSRGVSGGAAGVDVSAALGKIQPHLRGGGGSGRKKFPRACALLTELLCAKLSSENEELFFHALSDAVSSCRSACNGGRVARGNTPAASGAGDGGCGRGEALGRKAEAGEGIVVDAVRRLVVAACARSSTFHGLRRDAVETWGEELMVKRATEDR